MRALALLLGLGLAGCGSLVPYALAPGWLAPDVVPEADGSSIVVVGQQPADPALSPGAVRGRVLDLRTGRPVVGARVTVSGFATPGPVARQTGDEGAFAFVGAPEGEVGLQAEAPGYVPAADALPVDPGAEVDVLVMLRRVGAAAPATGGA